MAFEDKEQFRVLFLDKRNQLIADEVQQTGTGRHARLAPVLQAGRNSVNIQANLGLI